MVVTDRVNHTEVGEIILKTDENVKEDSGHDIYLVWSIVTMPGCHIKWRMVLREGFNKKRGEIFPLKGSGKKYFF